MIEFAALLRLIPYALVAYIAVKKGFYRLAWAALLLIAVAILSASLHLPQDMRSTLASVLSLLLLLHALDLKPRRSV